MKLALATILTTHLLILFAGFFAPYDYAAQNRDSPFEPPMRLHFTDAVGGFHLRPVVYSKLGPETSEQPADRAMTAYPLRFLVSGTPYRLLGIFHSQTHLFGVDPPARVFLLGTDAYGRDVFSRLLYGGQISLAAGIVATAISLSLGLALGGLAGYHGKWVDAGIMYATEAFLALPWLYLLFAVRAFLPLDVNSTRVFLLLIAVVGIIGWAQPARVVRGIVLSAKERDYVLAARGFGASSVYLLRRHILPEAYTATLALAGVYLSRYILAEVVLSFFGLGVSEPTPSWGNMFAELRRYQVLRSYWWMFAPAFLLVPVALAYQVAFSYHKGRINSLVTVSSPTATQHSAGERP